MTYYIDLFSPETYEAFTRSDRTITGFRLRQKNTASTIKAGDFLICYVTKLSRWVGILQVEDKYFVDEAPIFTMTNDPFVIRFKVKAIVWLNLEVAIPISEKICWNNLSFTKRLPAKSASWTGMVRRSLRRLEQNDGGYLRKILLKQLNSPVEYPLDINDIKKLKSPTVKTQDSKQVIVSIPENDEILPSSISQQQSIHRDSIKIQSMLAVIGERMNLKIWIPKSDRQKILDIWKPQSKSLLDILPLNYDDATLKTIENIDVLWIHGRSIVRAFEVEHTTSIYSGILRMADLMALQPNLNIRAHIVAPVDRKEKVLQEISRPVFAFLENGPLSESCSYISYDSIVELSNEKKLEYMNDNVIEQYEEFAEEADL
jgi:hypothetical protein